MHLPSHIHSLVSFKTLKMEKDSFVDKTLKKSILDILFSVKFDSEDGYVFLLLEYQSKPDYYMAFRLFKYMLNIAEYHMKATKSKKFPCIYLLVFDNGIQQYNVPRNLLELFENSELVKATWSNDDQLINVHDISEQALKENALSGILQFFMKHIHERDLLKRWQEVANLLPKFAKVNIGIDYIELILFYTLTKIRQSDIIEVARMLKSHLNPQKREKIMGSIAHYWEKQVIEKGRRKEKIIIAKNLIKADLKTELIIASTGLKKEEIEKLQQIA